MGTRASSDFTRLFHRLQALTWSRCPSGIRPTAQSASVFSHQPFYPKGLSNFICVHTFYFPLINNIFNLIMVWPTATSNCFKYLISPERYSQTPPAESVELRSPTKRTLIQFSVSRKKSRSWPRFLTYSFMNFDKASVDRINSINISIRAFKHLYCSLYAGYIVT
jgi:hypothetical protein